MARSSGAGSPGPAEVPVVYTLGHSTRAAEEFVALLRKHGIERLWDIRIAPGSRRFPHFNRPALARTLEEAGIRYEHVPALGGFRLPTGGTENAGWRNRSFRGYADHMATDEFRSAIDRLVRAAPAARIALMCAEAVPWRCHRTLVADALTARGVAVREIISLASSRPHRLTPWAHVEGDRVTYPASGQQRTLEGRPQAEVVPERSRRTDARYRGRGVRSRRALPARGS